MEGRLCLYLERIRVGHFVVWIGSRLILGTDFLQSTGCMQPNKGMICISLLLHNLDKSVAKEFRMVAGRDLET